MRNVLKILDKIEASKLIRVSSDVEPFSSIRLFTVGVKKAPFGSTLDQLCRTVSNQAFPFSLGGDTAFPMFSENHDTFPGIDLYAFSPSKALTKQQQEALLPRIERSSFQNPDIYFNETSIDPKVFSLIDGRTILQQITAKMSLTSTICNQLANNISIPPLKSDASDSASIYSLLELQRPLINVLLQEELPRLVAKYWTVLAAYFDQPYPETLTDDKNLLAQLDSFYEAITNVYYCPDVTVKFLAENKIKTLRTKIEQLRRYPDLFNVKNEQLYGCVMELNKLVYHNSLNEIDMTRVLEGPILRHPSVNHT